ncbi:TlpA family protein disulfide reductase [Kriegella aquimaris]|uniref:Thiol-disulfide isomerase or thioredoxin n=1 Tax=Kriegella aquimaris TaxID=192904 RepID=A0A1G9NQU0_9FLAO|nr:TlpA disulfide reductase family protein [Kriegella aquimaris]SDL88734.1 Thiol-disulfide isomerase or thioredoxin [Kriegella aquimaris]
MYKISVFLISFLLLGFTDQSDSAIAQKNLSTAEIPIYDFESLEPLLYTKTNKTHIINFWAMWCAPCVKELPVFEQYQKDHPEVEMLLVSLDFPEDIEAKLKPFLKKKGITTNVVVLDDPDANSWIDKIDPNWSGAIPFTIIFNNKERAFYERAFENSEDLKQEINNTIHPKK